MMDRDLPTPADFADASSAAIAACEGLGLRETAQRLAGDGLTGVVAAEEFGGLDLPFDYAVPLLSAAGSALLTFPLLETLIASRLLQASPAAASDIVAGQSLVTIAWTGTAQVKETDGALQISGIVGNASRADECDVAIVRTQDGGAVLVSLDAVKVAALGGLDQDRPSCQLTLDNVRVAAENRITAEKWLAVEADAWLGFAALLLGGAQTCLDMAEEHANTRVQFGKALSANQAMRHLLARQKLQLEGIRNILDSCFLAEGTADLARRKATFVAAGDNAIAIIEKAIQVHGGMGFTWEVPLHRYLRWAHAMRFQGDTDAVLLSLADGIINQHGGQAA